MRRNLPHAPVALLLATAVAFAPAVSRPADAPRVPTAPPSDVAAAVSAAWLGLAASESECPEHYDYFPNGGLEIFYCHASSLLTFERLEDLAGMCSTRAAPGVSPALAGAFRHYDPRFVQWLAKALLPAKQDKRFREKTQPVYDGHVAPLARQYLAVRRLMTAHRRSLEAEVRWVKDAIESGALPDRYYQSRYAGFGGSGFPDDPESKLDGTGWDVNVGPTAVAFWIRRELDGSAPAFTAALEELVSIYDGAWLRAGAGVVKANLAKEPFPAQPARTGEPPDTRTRPAAKTAPADGPPAADPAGAICGEVMERLPAAPYTFVQLATAQGREWAAVEAPVCPRQRVCVRNPRLYKGYRSEMLNRTFERVYFGE